MKISSKVYVDAKINEVVDAYNAENVSEEVRYGVTLANALKEIMNNGVTAGATTIYCDITNTGDCSDFISIKDNGNGVKYSAQTISAVFNEGHKRNMSSLSENGEGLKKATLSIAKGADISFMSKHKKDTVAWRVSKLMFPGEKITINKLDEEEFPLKHGFIVEFPLRNDNMKLTNGDFNLNKEALISYLSFFYHKKMISDNFKIVLTINGEKSVLSKSSLEKNHTKISFEENYDGETIIITNKELAKQGFVSEEKINIKVFLSYFPRLEKEEVPDWSPLARRAGNQVIIEKENVIVSIDAFGKTIGGIKQHNSNNFLCCTLSGDGLPTHVIKTQSSKDETYVAITKYLKSHPAYKAWYANRKRNEDFRVKSNKKYALTEKEIAQNIADNAKRFLNKESIFEVATNALSLSRIDMVLKFGDKMDTGIEIKAKKATIDDVNQLENYALDLNCLYPDMMQFELVAPSFHDSAIKKVQNYSLIRKNVDFTLILRNSDTMEIVAASN